MIKVWMFFMRIPYTDRYVFLGFKLEELYITLFIGESRP